MTGSEVWKEIVRGARNEARKHHEQARLSVLYPDSYHSQSEFVDNTVLAIKSRPDKFIVPFTPAGSEKIRFLEALNAYEGKIVAINVPPDRLARTLLSDKLIGYVGINHIEAGREAVRQLARSVDRCETIAVLIDKTNHYGYSLQIQGIKEIAELCEVQVEEIPFERKEPLVLPNTLPDKFNLIASGIRSTEKALTIDRDRVLGIVGTDLNDDTAQAIRDGRMVCTIIQYPEAQGRLAVRLCAHPQDDFAEILCGPTVVNQNNVNALARS